MANLAKEGGITPTRPLVLFGAGNMGASLLQGWLGKSLDPQAIIIIDPTPNGLAKKLIATHNIPCHRTPKALTKAWQQQKTAPVPALIVLAVKPQIMTKAAPLKHLAKDSTAFLSIAAGITLKQLAGMMEQKHNLFRSMPNICVTVGRGITALCGSKPVQSLQRKLCTRLLGAVGEVVWFEKEQHMSSVTAISGSGPAYLFYFTECLILSGEAMGLDKKTAKALAKATVIGAATMMEKSTESPAKLRARVTSVKGTTHAALTRLANAKDGLKPLMKRTCKAAKTRARELTDALPDTVQR